MFASILSARNRRRQAELLERDVENRVLLTFSADRYRDVDGGKVAAWVVDGSSMEYARFDVQQVEVDARDPS